MREIEILAGCNIKEALESIKSEATRCGEVCYCKFNDSKIYSTDSLNTAYLKITGKTYTEFMNDQAKAKDDWNRAEEEHKAKIPELSKYYIEKARGLVKDSELGEWDNCVPIRLGDLYHGMELEETLKACATMRDMSIPYNERLKKAYNDFMAAGHSGMSASLVAGMIKKFCPDGEDLADAVMHFRFGNGN